MPSTEEKKYFTYKGKPMVRRGDLIYYGNPEDRYIVLFTVKGKRKVGDLEVANEVTVELMSNNGRGKERTFKRVTRAGLFEAMDVGEFWLADALENG